MSGVERFLDTNVLLYLFSADDAKANRAEEIVGEGGIVSVQVLNEFAAVATRKLKMSIAETREALAVICAVCSVEAMTGQTHDRGLEIAERFAVSIYGSMIIASALLAGCNTILSEDMQDGLVIDGSIAIRNPFK
jgi:predicted nucleic acid-binding protein